MQANFQAATRAPTDQPTLPRPAAATAPAHADIPKTPGWLKGLRQESGYRTIAILLDIWAAAWSVVLALWWTSGPVFERHIALWIWLFVPILVIMMASRMLYRRRLSPHFLDELEPLETSVAVSALLTLTIMLMVIPPLAANQAPGQYVRPSEVGVKVWVCATVLVPSVRLARSLTQRYLRRKYRFGSPALFVGTGPLTRQLIHRMRQSPEYGLHPVGVLDDTPPDGDPPDVPYLGTTDDLESAVRQTGAEALVVAPTSTTDDKLALAAQRAEELGLQVRVVPRLMDAVGGAARIEHLGGVPLLVLNRADPKGWQFAVKHAFDRSAAALGLLLISPLFLSLAMLVKLSSPGPIFFGQDRIGRDGKVFQCLKFRSMRPPEPADAVFAPQAGAAPGGVEGDDRRTRIGKFLRKTSLDELPQLINVLRGDMSLVGPRPERPEFVELFDMQIRRYGQRHRVKAGITGWAQVHGLRGQTSIADRAEFDNYYIENWSLLLDVKILILTVLAVLRPTED
ncbi:sugar transferase [Mycolicibacterium austroafricanum]|uniref:sugar transferase n=1 Tax=Mycolicibacterium austroafricanum TaxID=39687 RepID=UPI001CA36A2E|nr:sugar transferase [Mycolicibacterium austroafricanum]QZT58442.1 sugar transferase [Mycolicibacterium austroafricanum]